MGKVFTITEGLENMGALKTGGQGSVYKGRRIGEIITAVKLLPTPIHSESVDDKNFRDFQNEVQKLKKVNESPNPNVVRILSSGITETGAFPFIEMEFIEGPDLEELLKEPHDPIFTVKEVLKVAEQLSCALAHCHRVAVKHGDIKSNNVKFNVHTGNYVLLDFGLAVMSDEQRRTSLRHAGAIEFMAPEQNEGQMLFQTDVYSFGVVLFELLGGRVPFPLTDRGETARNTVMIAHMETPPPDVLELRQQHHPQSWSAEKSAHEMLVPQWLVSLVYKCLQKHPDDRFSNGMELHEYIIRNSTMAGKGADSNVATVLTADHNRLISDKNQLQQSLLQYQQEVKVKERRINELTATVQEKENELAALRNNLAGIVNGNSRRSGVSTGAFMALLLLTLAFGGLAAYSFFRNQSAEEQLYSNSDTVEQTNFTNNDRYEDKSIADNSPGTGVAEAPTTTITDPIQDTAATTRETVIPSQTQEPQESAQETNDSQQTDTENTTATKASGPRYTVASSKAYFHNEPYDSTRRAAYMIPSNDVVLQPLDEQNGFIYVVFTNSAGQTSKGWLRKQDLKLIEE